MPHFPSAVEFGSILHTLGGWKMFVLSAKPTKNETGMGPELEKPSAKWRFVAHAGLFYLYGIISTMSCSPSAPSSLFHSNPQFQPLIELLLWPTGDENSVLIVSTSTSTRRDETKETVCCQHGAYGLPLR